MSTRRNRRGCKVCGLSRQAQAEVLLNACKYLDNPGDCKKLASDYAKGKISSKELVERIRELKRKRRGK